jgi:hypothetical protein
MYSSDGFPTPVAIAIGLAFAFAVGLLTLYAFGGLPLR